MKGILKKTKEFSEEMVLIKAFAIILKDKYGQFVYTFKDKKEADKFYKFLTPK